MVALKKMLQTPVMSSSLKSRFGVKCVNHTLFRLQSTSTMAHLSQSHSEASIQSQRSKTAIQSQRSILNSEKKDFSTRVASDFEVLNQAVLSVSLAHQPSSRVVAHMMNLAEAAASNHNYDKILLLVNHGEAAVRKNSPLGISLTGKGFGQALTLSRQAAVFCNTQTGLSPELVVLAPLGCSIQTALYAFPYSSPISVRGVDWICHGQLVANEEPTCVSVLEKNFPGVDFSAHGATGSQKGANFLSWLQGRHERVIVGK